jgi:hypothetical protein
VSQNRLLRRLCGPKREEVTVSWRKLCSEEVYSWYSLPGTIRMVKSMRVGSVRHVACVWEKRCACKILVGKFGWNKPLQESLDEINHFIFLSMDQSVVCKWIIRNKMAQCGLNSSDSGQGQVVGCCIHCSDPTDSIKCGEFVV